MPVTFENISWRVHVRAAHETKVRRVLELFAGALDQPITLDSIEKYWKIPGQYVAEFRTPLAMSAPQDAVFETLRRCHRVGDNWCVSGPHSYANQVWEFEAMCSAEGGGSFTVPGPVWAHVSVTNGHHPRRRTQQL